MKPYLGLKNWFWSLGFGLSFLKVFKMQDITGFGEGDTVNNYLIMESFKGQEVKSGKGVEDSSATTLQADGKSNGAEYTSSTVVPPNPKDQDVRHGDTTAALVFAASLVTLYLIVVYFLRPYFKHLEI